MQPQPLNSLALIVVIALTALLLWPGLIVALN